MAKASKPRTRKKASSKGAAREPAPVDVEVVDVVPGDPEVIDEEPDEDGEREQDEAKDEPFDLVALRASIKVLESGSLSELRAPVRDVCEDKIQRERLFGRARNRRDRQNP